MLLDHFPDRALNIIQSTLSDLVDNPHSRHGNPDRDRTYSAPATQSVSYHIAGAGGRTPPLADLPSVHVHLGGHGMSGEMPQRAKTTPPVLDTEVLVAVEMPQAGGPTASTRARKPAAAAAAALQVATDSIEVDVAMSTTSALSRVSSTGAMGGGV